MHNHQSCYSRWTWIVALVLALILLLMLLTGNGPSRDCCGSATPVEAATAATESFGFTAHCNDFTSKGDASAWAAHADKLKSILCSGEALQAEGDEKHALLTGVVESDAAKVKLGEEIQAIFGANIALENQTSVKAAEPVVIDQTPIDQAPTSAKLYFDIAKSNLPSSSNDTLAPIVTWLKAHPNAKVVISGFHDASGNKELNHQKARAKSTFDALVATGVDAANIEMRKPTETLGTGDPKEARRVDVSIE